MAGGIAPPRAQERLAWLALGVAVAPWAIAQTSPSPPPLGTTEPSSPSASSFAAAGSVAPPPPSAPVPAPPPAASNRPGGPPESSRPKQACALPSDPIARSLSGDHARISSGRGLDRRTAKRRPRTELGIGRRAAAGPRASLPWWHRVARAQGLVRCARNPPVTRLPRASAGLTGPFGTRGAGAGCTGGGRALHAHRACGAGRSRSMDAWRCLLGAVAPRSDTDRRARSLPLPVGLASGHTRRARPGRGLGPPDRPRSAVSLTADVHPPRGTATWESARSSPNSTSLFRSFWSLTRN